VTNFVLITFSFFHQRAPPLKIVSHFSRQISRDRGKTKDNTTYTSVGNENRMGRLQRNRPDETSRLYTWIVTNKYCHELSVHISFAYGGSFKHLLCSKYEIFYAGKHMNIIVGKTRRETVVSTVCSMPIATHAETVTENWPLRRCPPTTFVAGRWRPNRIVHFR
jgi:hypothetical protein